MGKKPRTDKEMMNDTSLMDYTDIYTLLNKEHNLADTFPNVREKARLLANWDITNEVENLWHTYQQMLQFAIQGVKDTEAETMRNDIVDQLSRLTVRIQRLERLNKHKEQRYVSKWREVQNVSSLESAVNALKQVAMDIDAIRRDELIRESVKTYNLNNLEAEHEQCLVRLFNYLWTSEPWKTIDANIASNLLFSNNITSDDKAVLISAITLALLEYPDNAKLMLLLDCYLLNDTQVSQRALVGFVLTIALMHDPHYAYSAPLRARLEMYKDDPEFINDLFMAMTQLQASTTTDKVTTKMQQDIMPDIIQAHLKRNKDTKLDIDQLNIHGENPEWLDNERVTKKLHEMSDLQLAGADIYYSSFVHMKNHAFFNEMAHWFYPFSENNFNVPEVKKLLNSKIGTVAKLMLYGGPFCNSDKYSLCFTFNNIGQIGEKMLEQQILSQLPEDENIEEIAKESAKTTQQKRTICRHYIFDLYRFYHTYPYNTQLVNPFDELKQHPLTPISNETLAMLLLHHTNNVEQYADFLMRKEYYRAASEQLNILIAQDTPIKHTPAVWQKLGFCYQHMGDNKKHMAYNAYDTANTLKPNSKWTLTHLIATCENLNKHDQTIKHCQQLLAIEPDNVKYMLKSAHTHIMANHDYTQALPLLHKALYLDPQSEQAQTLLALSLIMTGKQTKAMKHILELKQSTKHHQDANTLYAIAMLLDGNTSEAYQALQKTSPETRTTQLFQHCLNTINKNNPTHRTTLQLLLDALTLNNH